MNCMLYVYHYVYFLYLALQHNTHTDTRSHVCTISSFTCHAFCVAPNKCHDCKVCLQERKTLCYKHWFIQKPRISIHPHQRIYHLPVFTESLITQVFWWQIFILFHCGVRKRTIKKSPLYSQWKH